MKKLKNETHFTILRAVIFSALFFLPLLVWSPRVEAQQIDEGPRVQVFGGYSRVQFDSKSFGFSDNTGLNGWTASGAYNLLPEFGIVGQIGGHYGPNLRVVEWLIGPQVRYHWKVDFFGHLMFGKAQTRVISSATQEDTNLAYTMGGGFDFPISDRLSIRVIEADYFRTRAIGTDQSNIKYSTGLVYRWGSVKRHKPPKLTAP